ncbi:TonB-dependent receptor [Maribellus maritimus]|uniref:TonB-dependent receptor n=1 Tax=Maribellus maritimus TaxID=2870838 RepID=UPI001EE9E3CF|nr:TonB-dependent receptor [Maribellus maritimus]MCG6188191.1 TonB-dependent receptor [Maribellus maritimus]
MNIKYQIKFVAIVLFSLIVFQPAFSQQNSTISGYVSDASSGERLSGATVYVPESGKGASCNEYGFFSLTIPSAQTTVVFRFVGYEPFVFKLKIPKDTVLNVQLNANNTIEEVKVTATSKEDFLLSPAFGMHRLNAKQVEQIPAVLGEPDLLKAIQLLPGVSFSTEGSTGFSVRGGSPDQTLIQLDGVPVYNVNHLWGFMSAFNNDAISETKLYKGSLPARFGGRLGSVLDVRMKEGNLKKRTGTFSVSPIAGRYTLEGPIVKDKVSFMVSGRTTWANLLLSAAQRLEGQNNEESQLLTYGFWDINAKTNWMINRNNRLYLSFYTGRDAFVTEDGGGRYQDYTKFSYNWQNLTSVLRWNRIFSPVLFANFSAYNSRFRQEYLNKFDKNGKDEYKGYNNLNDWSLKGDFDWLPETGVSFKFGFQLSNQKFSPEIISYTSDSTSFTLNDDIFTRNIISEVYLESEVELPGNLKGSFGLRGGNLATQNKNYWSLRPRVALSYLFSEQVSGKVSWSRMKQYLHQLQNTTLGIPTELWVSSTDKIKPGTSDLFSAGLFWKLKGKYQFSAETFYTSLQDVIRYKDGTTALKERGDSWEDYVVSGKGESYGLELMAEKTTGNLTGWIAYTLSKSTRQFDEINFGKIFPYAYDRRHKLNVNVNWFLGQKSKKGMVIKRNLSGTFNFASGKYITLAEQEYQAIPLPLMEGSRYRADWFATRSYINSVNNYRMPDFHNLNLSYRIERQSADKTIIWDFSVYNVYNRLNPWYYYKKGDQMKQITLFPIIPSVGFKYEF